MAAREGLLLEHITTAPEPRTDRQREIWLDIVKGIAIILVVMTHIPTPIPFRIYLNWLHMPLFFAVSGYLFRPARDWASYWQLVGKRAVQLLVPYIAALVVLTLAQCLLAGSWYIDWRHFYPGGKYLYGDGVALWFLTCMFMTQVIFSAVMLAFRAWYWRVAIVLALFALAHVEAMTPGAAGLPIPWALDASLLAIGYFGFGYLARPIMKIASRPVSYTVMSMAVGVSILLVVGGQLGFVNYYLDILHLAYQHPVYDLLIPPTLTLATCGIGHLLERIRWLGAGLAYIGTATLPIMTWHLLAYHLVSVVTGSVLGPVLFTCIGVFVPLALTRLVFDRFEVTRRLFLGAAPSTKTRNTLSVTEGVEERSKVEVHAR